MSGRIPRRRAVLGAAFGASVIALLAVIAATATAAPPRFTANPLSPVSRAEAPKSQTGQLAQTDPALLGRTDATPVDVMVKLDYDSTATYDGGVAGLAATSPSETGKELRENRGAVDAYESYTAQVESGVVDSIRSRVPGAQVRDSFRTVYGGVALRVPANQIDALLAVDGVVAVQQDKISQPLATSVDFVGAPAVWPSLGGQTQAGDGVIVGVLDTGIWPENPLFDDPGTLSSAPGAYGCEFGDGTDPLLGDPFVCNDKVIGSYAFTDTYMAVIGALPGEYCNNLTGQCSARDADGHGSHTLSTAAGSVVENALHFGIDRGQVSGIAPGAHVIMYRVCLDLGCFGSDSVAAVEQAILDGVDVINFSISGGGNAYTDPVELAFLEAYDAGVSVSASAGNSGPGAGTADHAGPWVTTVGASTYDHMFLTTLHLESSDGATFSAVGSSVTQPIDDPTPVALAADVGGDVFCSEPLAPGSADGLVVVCSRGGGIGRNQKASNVDQGGAAGMILYNPTHQDLFTDPFWVPTVMLDGPEPAGALVAFLEAHDDITATWETGERTPVTGDVMTTFSSRGPLGDFIKPDVTAPGIQILAGNTFGPHPAAVASGPPGEYFMAIAGTSMSSPHSAGVSALVKAAHPDWTPGQIKSALMTSSVQSVLKEDSTTPADPFDRGAGSIRADRAVNPTVTFDVTTAEYVASAADPLNRVHLNTPSINAPTMSGLLITSRTMKNVSGQHQRLDISTQSSPGTSITVFPSKVNLRPNESKRIKIVIEAVNAPKDQQYFGQITLSPRGGSSSAVLPVAFFKKQGVVALTHACAPLSIPVRTSTHCEVQAANFASQPANVTLAVVANQLRSVTNVDPPGRVNPFGLTWRGTLSPAVAPRITAVEPDPLFGYIPLSGFGVPSFGPVADEEIINLDVDPYLFGTEAYDRVGMVSNGYAVVGGGESGDIEFVPQTLPDPARPNNVLAPFWTDLDPSAGGDLRAAVLSDGTTDWIVLEWEDVRTFGAPEMQSFQIWIETAATAEGIHYAYGDVNGAGSADGLTVGAENRDGTSGVNYGPVPADGDELAVRTTGPTAGGTVTIGYDAVGRRTGTLELVAALTSDVTPGITTEKVSVTVTRR